MRAGCARRSRASPLSVPASAGVRRVRETEPWAADRAEPADHAVRARKGSRVPYKTPDRDVVAIIDAPPTPVALLAPGRRFVALVHYESHPPIALLARGYLPLAGIRIDPVLAGRQRVRRLTGLSVLRLADGTEQVVALPDGAQPSAPAWAPDGRTFAFTVDEPDGIGVWVADAETATARQVPGLRVRDVLGGDPLTIGAAVRWTRDGSALLALGAPARRTRRPSCRRRRRAAHRGDGGQAVADGDLPGPAAHHGRRGRVRGAGHDGAAPGRAPDRGGQGARAARALPAAGRLPGRRAPAGAPDTAAVLVPGPVSVLRAQRGGVVGRGRPGARRGRAGRERRGPAAGRARPARGRCPGRSGPRPAWSGPRPWTAGTPSPPPSTGTASCGSRRRSPGSQSPRSTCSTAASAGSTWTSRTG